MVVFNLLFNSFQFRTRMQIPSVGFSVHFNCEKVLRAVTWVFRLITSTSWLATTAIICVNGATPEIICLRESLIQKSSFLIQLLNVLWHTGATAFLNA